MKKRFLLTSFTTWLPHHNSNASDDLLISCLKIDDPLYDLHFLRLLPVDVDLASRQVIEKINSLQPDVIICCGMAEKRHELSVESNASDKETVLHTTVDLENLVADSQKIEISHDCGKFVCEALYYSVLDFLKQKSAKIYCLFVHVPILTEENHGVIFEDFRLIINRLALL